MEVSVDCKTDDDFKQAKILADEFGIEIIRDKKNLAIHRDLPTDVTGNAFQNQAVYLNFEEGQFDLRSEDGLKLKISFLKDRRFRRSFYSPKKELICKSCGWHLGCRKILDLTAGLAMDSVFLAQTGFQVTALERNPMLYLLLKTAQKTALSEDPNGIWSNLNIIKTEALDYLKNNLALENAPDVIYYDPMYPSATKTALPPKEMQIFRRLLGENEADIKILDLAIVKTAKLVVVKRPFKAPPLHSTSKISPSRSYLGKLVRYDVYSH
jgi:16S rRNA (guanine1516-N2)-methyltransferase